MNEHPDVTTLHDLVDGLLDAPVEAEVRSHTDTCLDCRRELSELRDTLAALRGLPRAARVPDHLWAGVRERIGAADPGPGAPDRNEAEVVALPGAQRRPRTLVVSVPRLAAAGIAVALVSAGTVWALMRGGADESVPAVASLDGPGRTTAVIGPAARAASTSGAGYDRAIAELEAIVDAGRDVLTPETLATLEGSLATIDRALLEVAQALEEDPSSELLMSMMVSHQTSKIRVLRQAATAIQARS